MISNLGNFFLFFSLFSITFFYTGWSKKIFTSDKVFLNLIYITSASPFLVLVIGFAISDYTVLNIFQNSYIDDPTFYKVTSAWGSHEGSILLWIFLINIYGIFFLKTNNNKEIHKQIIFISSLFILYLLISSNPFQKIELDTTLDGLGLNPILQHLLFIIHPPTLFLGYIGLIIPFVLASHILISKNFSKDLFNQMLFWSKLSWFFLTFGIVLGSYWAYSELGWGGWWFWDPVENISLMPWIVGLALVHSLIMTRGEQAIERWIIFLSILCFSLSILGTFLVRSGILTSVHSFASDASRGLFILLIFFLTTGFGLLVFLVKSPLKKNHLNLLLINKTSALIINNILMIIAMLTILLGTIYPIIIEVLTNTRISVGGPYFNSTVLPVLLPGFLLMSVAPVLSWQSNKIKKFRVYVVFFLFLSFLALIHSYFTVFNTWGFLGLILGSWIILASIISIILRFKFLISLNYIKSINSFIAHIGVGLMILGITFSSIYQKEYSFNISVGEEININNNILKLENIKVVENKNYQSLMAVFSLRKKGELIDYILPGKNYYPVSKMITTEAGIYHDWLKDIYITLGNEEDSTWNIKIYLNPLVSFIWIGVCIMIFSGFIAIFKK